MIHGMRWAPSRGRGGVFARGVVLEEEVRRMSIVMGWTSIGRRSRRSGSNGRAARSRARVGRRTAPGCVGSWPGSRGSSWRSRLRRRPAGGSSSRSCGRWAPRCISPSRRRRRRGAATSSARRPIGRTPAISVSCCWPGGCRSRGSRRTHILDLRARVRLRHTLIDQHSEWQQRIQAVLYHHGCPQRRQPDQARGPRLARAARAARGRTPADHGLARR